MKCPHCGEHISKSEIARHLRGKSGRKLDPEKAREMAAERWRKEREKGPKS